MESPATCATCGAANPEVDDQGMHVGMNHSATSAEGGESMTQEGGMGGGESTGGGMEGGSEGAGMGGSEQGGAM